MQNKLLQEAISEVRSAGIEPGNILPEIKLNRATSCLLYTSLIQELTEQAGA